MYAKKKVGHGTKQEIKLKYQQIVETRITLSQNEFLPDKSIKDSDLSTVLDFSGGIRKSFYI